MPCCNTILSLLSSCNTNWYKQSACAAAGHCRQNIVAIIIIIIFSLSFSSSLSPIQVLFSQKVLSQGSEILHATLSYQNNNIAPPPSSKGRTQWPLLSLLFFLSLFLHLCLRSKYFSPRRCYPRVLKFCMRPSVTKIIILHPPHLQKSRSSSIFKSQGRLPFKNKLRLSFICNTIDVVLHFYIAILFLF